MIFKELKIKGVYLISPEPYKDKRGLFRRHFCAKEFKKKILNLKLDKATYLKINS